MGGRNPYSHLGSHITLNDKPWFANYSACFTSYAKKYSYDQVWIFRVVPLSLNFNHERVCNLGTGAHEENFIFRPHLMKLNGEKFRREKKKDFFRNLKVKEEDIFKQS